MHNTMKTINYIPFINWLSSFGGGVSKKERIVMVRVNTITMLLIALAVFGVLNTIKMIAFIVVFSVISIIWGIIKRII